MKIGTWWLGQAKHYIGYPDSLRLTIGSVYLCQKKDTEMIITRNDNQLMENFFIERFEVLHIFSNNKLIELIHGK